jgi:hypothetical protein
MMPRAAHTTSRNTPLLDVLDRVLAKGIVISYDIDVSILGLRAIEIDGNVIVQSLESYVEMDEATPQPAGNSTALITAVDEYLRRLPPQAIEG